MKKFNDPNEQAIAEKLDQHDLTIYLRLTLESDAKNVWNYYDAIRYLYTQVLNEGEFNMSLETFMEYLTDRYGLGFDELIRYDVKLRYRLNPDHVRRVYEEEEKC